MKALVKARAEPGIWMQDIPEPSVGHNDVLIKVNRSAICGTDMHIFNWDAWAQKSVPVPMAVGHEYSGEIVELGSEVRGFNTGDRVSGEGHITCGHCRNCRAGRRHLCRNTLGVGVNRPGAFAEYLTIPASNVFKLPAGIDDEIASILDPLGNATHTALAFNVVGEDVLITGAGPIGVMAVAIARHCGARHIVITDINDYRLGLAAKMGASRTLNVTRESLDDAMRDLGMEEGFDVGFEMSGNPAALRELLRLYVPGSTSIQARQTEGVLSVSSRPVVRRIPGAGPVAAGRGLEVALTIDEAPFGGAGGVLLAAVLDRFFAKYVSINAFTETVMRTPERGEVMRWPMRIGLRPTL